MDWVKFTLGVALLCLVLVIVALEADRLWLKSHCIIDNSPVTVLENGI